MLSTCGPGAKSCEVLTCVSAIGSPGRPALGSLPSDRAPDFGLAGLSVERTAGGPVAVG